MKFILKYILGTLGLLPFVKNKIRTRRNENTFLSEFNQIKQQSYKTQKRLDLNWESQLPCLTDKTSITVFDAHYTYHPAWAARILSQTKPEMHIDISSILHFSTIISAFIPIKFYDYRPAQLNLNNISSDFADLTDLSFESNSINSLSCMHTVEHIGLGRYGDPIDYDGDLKAIDELKRVVSINGNLLFVVPIGKPVIVFNAHRIYSYDQIINYFSGFQLKNFSLIPDNAINEGIIDNASKELADKQNYGCGCFWFQKISLTK
jgi:hypothetical protein